MNPSFKGQLWGKRKVFRCSGGWAHNARLTAHFCLGNRNRLTGSSSTPLAGDTSLDPSSRLSLGILSSSAGLNDVKGP